jgi:hypothetical protein
VAPLPDPLSDFSGFAELGLDEVLESFFAGLGFFSDFSFEGFGVSFGSAFFFRVSFGLGFDVGLGESFGVGVALDFGRAVGVGVGEGI